MSAVSLTCEHVDVVLEVGGHLLLLNGGDTPTGEHHHHVHSTQAAGSADGRAASVP